MYLYFNQKLKRDEVELTTTDEANYMAHLDLLPINIAKVCHRLYKTCILENIGLKMHHFLARWAPFVNSP